MTDDIRRLSDELAQDPDSLAFLRLGELLRRQRDLASAGQVAARGCARHPSLADAHDLVARVAADRGDLSAAAEAWMTALQLMPTHSGAGKGLGFLAYREGRFADAARFLAGAAESNPNDASIAAALSKVRGLLAESAPARPSLTPANAVRAVNVGQNPFADVAGGSNAVLAVDRDGLVLAGTSSGGAHRAAEIGAYLAGVSDEATRAMRHLELGDWSALVVEAPDAVIALAPVGDEALVLVAAPATMPLGQVRRNLARVAERAATWLGALK